MFKCPECGTSKFKDFKECNTCGWKKPREDYSSRNNNHVIKQCYVITCKNKDVEECAYNPAIQMCRFHHDECTLKFFPDSPRADIIRLARYFDEQAKNTGMSGKDYFESTDPVGYEVSQKRMSKSYQDAKPVSENVKHVLDV